MPKQYPQEAVDLCRSLFCKYGGKNHDQIQAEMQKVYPGWRKKNLYDIDSKDPKNVRLGWITKYGFENSLRLHIEKLTEKVNDDEQDLYLGIKTIRKQLQVEAIGRNADKDNRREFREYAKIEIEARRNLDLSRDNLETFVSGYEKLVMWLGELDPAAAKMLIKHGEKLAELAQAHYGKAETEYDGAIDREDEGRDEPFSLLH